MDHAGGAQAELVGVAAGAEVLGAHRRGGFSRARGAPLAALAVLGEADDVFHQWAGGMQFDSFYSPAFQAAYIDRKPKTNDTL
jgi:hypothetical protein